MGGGHSFTAMQEKHPLMKPLVIMLCGAAGSGKSTFGTELFKALRVDTDVYKAAFASSLKEAVHDAEDYFGTPNTDWNDYPTKNAARPLLVELGRHLRRKDPDVFVALLWEKAYSDRAFPPAVLLVEDWRYLNEYKYLAQRTTVLPVRMNPARIPANEEEANSLMEIDAVFHELPSAMVLPSWTDDTALSSMAMSMAGYIRQILAAKKEGKSNA